nr:gravity specific cDNA [Oryza sativa]BAA01911.1 unnamed protein product [Oryza sativa Japonica Group]
MCYTKRFQNYYDKTFKITIDCPLDIKTTLSNSRRMFQWQPAPPRQISTCSLDVSSRRPSGTASPCMYEQPELLTCRGLLSCLRRTSLDGALVEARPKRRHGPRLLGAELVHGVEVQGRLLLRLPTGQEDDGGHGSGSVL